ncbi:unnamed protein product [Didymodactylos carnosus]|uniref:Uncharacterized protein n=1 Tax=Didymodactylos carnosus TaxID=1234261 RepID=A0A814UD98_9BILA|nr:unnamed protein product [Didymodactylos carnosus]CAF1172531.1 unnamed protein product [Didymodactylos carnosus]CAF3704192.1 unnamed protein product [Didymodactylos carnosus]CAF3936427.1 unnamed protein product [Didymodactylos carnosus]
MHYLLLVLIGVYAVNGATLLGNRCQAEFRKAHLSKNLNVSVAHTIHSLTVPALRLFNPRATVDNHIPTVNQNLHGTGPKVVMYAPDEILPTGYYGFTMQMIDKILSMIGKQDDGLGPHWSAVERIAHKFHMWDLWARLQPEVEKLNPKPSEKLCACLLDTEKNGILEAVQWIANHYESGTPITLLDRPIPKLVDAKAWDFWKNDLLHYYDAESLHDAATYLHCATKDF